MIARPLTPLLLLPMLFTTGCVFSSKTVYVYDEACNINVRKEQLSVQQVRRLKGCSNEKCVSDVVAASIVSAGSAIVAGSVVIASNIAYWFENQEDCQLVNGPEALHPEPSDGRVLQ